MNYTGSIAQPIEYNNEFYFSASELLPWLNVECYEQDGVLYVVSDALSFWEVLEGFTYQDYIRWDSETTVETVVLLTKVHN